MPQELYRQSSSYENHAWRGLLHGKRQDDSDRPYKKGGYAKGVERSFLEPRYLGGRRVQTEVVERHENAKRFLAAAEKYIES